MLGFVICRVVVASKFGKVLVAIRDAETRMRFLGYRVEAYKLMVFTLSACMAGVAGALYVPQVGIINPSEFSPANSIEAVIWVAVGGRGTLTGAVLGAVLVNYAKTYFTSGLLAPYWLFVLGGLFVAVTLLLPRGIVGTIHHWWSGWRARRVPAATQPRRKQRRGRRSELMDPRTTTALLYLNGVTVSFDGFRALNNLSFTIETGEMRAIIGPNGAGKTTMMDVVTGKTRPDDRGRVFRRLLRPLPARRDRDRAARHRPQVPEADRVRDAHGRGQYRPCAQERPARAQDPALARNQRGSAPASIACSRPSGCRRCAAGRGLALARSEAVARDRHAAGAGTQASAGR